MSSYYQKQKALQETSLALHEKWKYHQSEANRYLNAFNDIAQEIIDTYNETYFDPTYGGERFRKVNHYTTTPAILDADELFENEFDVSDIDAWWEIVVWPGCGRRTARDELKMA